MVFQFSVRKKKKTKTPNQCGIFMSAYSSGEPAASVEEVLTSSATTIHPRSAASVSSCDSDPCKSFGGSRPWLSSGSSSVLMSVTECGESLSHLSSSHRRSSRVVKSTVIPGGWLPWCVSSGLDAAATDGSSGSAAARVSSAWWWWAAQRLGGLSADASDSPAPAYTDHSVSLETLQATWFQRVMIPKPKPNS